MSTRRRMMMQSGEERIITDIKIEPNGVTFDLPFNIGYNDFELVIETGTTPNKVSGWASLVTTRFGANKFVGLGQWGSSRRFVNDITSREFDAVKANSSVVLNSTNPLVDGVSYGVWNDVPYSEKLNLIYISGLVGFREARLYNKHTREIISTIIAVKKQGRKQLKCTLNRVNYYYRIP